MTLPCLRNILLLLDLFVVFGHCATHLNITGEAITTRFWDCCKPSCGWKGKADVDNPVSTCSKDDKPIDKDAASGCKGSIGFLCSSQHPWAINDTLSYGYAGVFLQGHADTESYWCCACYQLTFKDERLKNKTMIVQASNTAYDVNTENRFSLAIPGGNITQEDGCTTQYGLDQTVFGRMGSGVSSSKDCDQLPEHLRESCRWRFDWFKDALYPSVSFKRVVCPKEITDKTGCVRKDDKILAGEISLASTLSPTSSKVAVLAMIIAGLLWV